MKKYITILLLLLALGFLLFLGRMFFSEKCDPPLSYKNTGNRNVTTVMHTGTGAVGSFNPSASTNEASGYPELKSKMLSIEQVLKIAHEKASWRNTCDTNIPPRIELIDGQFVVTYWMYDTPFRRGSRKYDSKIKIDARSGEVIETLLAQGGVQNHILDRNSLGGNSDKEKSFNLKRLKTAWLERNMQIRNGHWKLPVVPQRGMLSAETVSNIAMQYARSRNRDFNPNRESMVTLIGDVYIVVLWRCPSQVKDDDLTYDSRIFVDAFTGEIIGMEVAQ